MLGEIIWKLVTIGLIIVAGWALTYLLQQTGQTGAFDIKMALSFAAGYAIFHVADQTAAFLRTKVK